MKLSVYTHQVGVSYRTAFRWFKSGKIQGRQMGTGTSLITEPISAPPPELEMLTYKAQLAGIQVIVQEEGYTSKCSFLDLEPIRKHAEYSGRRVMRAEFISAQGLPIHADINGSYNILRKALPTAFAHGVQGVVVRPVRVQPVQKLVNWHCL
jgi:hypothetical protein